MFLNNIIKKSFAFFSKVVFRFRLICSNLRLDFVRTLAEGRWIHVFIPFVVVIILAAIALGVAYGGICLVGKTSGYGGEPYKPSNIFDAAYYLLFTNGGQNLYDGAHWLGIIITSVGVVFIAVLTSMITNAFERIGQRYLTGESSFLMNNHIVIIGTSDVIYSILKSKRDGKARFLIMTSRDVASKRRELLSILDDESYNKRLCFLYGDRTSKKDVMRLSLAYAKEVFVIGDNEESDSIESYRDSYNMDCVDIIANDPTVIKLRNGRCKLPCHVMFEYQTTFVAFHFSEMGDAYREHLVFMPFNFYDMWAQTVLVAGAFDDEGTHIKYNFLDKLPNGNYLNKDSEESVHLIIVGMTKMGIALGLQAAQVCHFPNFISDNTRRTRITFIDADADIEFNYLNGRYRNLFQYARHRFVNLSSGKVGLSKPWANDASWLDVEWEFIKGRIESPKVQTYISDACDDKKHITTIAVCLNRSHQSLATAMFLPDSVFEKSLQILVNQRLSGTIINRVATSDNPKNKDIYRYKSLRPFGMIGCGYAPKYEDEMIIRSKYVSYVYDSYYRTTKEGKEKQKNDNSWDEKLENYNNEFYFYGIYADYEEYWAKEKKVWERISSQYNAELMSTRLRSIGIYDITKRTFDSIQNRINAEIDFLKQVEHNRWNIEKLLTGYRVLTMDEYDKLEKEWIIWNDKAKTEEEKQTAKDKWKNYRKTLKEWPYRAHLDLCSFDDLKNREEEDILKHDIKLNLAIPYIMKKEGTL